MSRSCSLLDAQNACNPCGKVVFFLHSIEGRVTLSKINKADIYEKNLNFLLGSGASYGLLPTLALRVKEKGSGKAHTVETLATKYEAVSYTHLTLPTTPYV